MGAQSDEEPKRRQRPIRSRQRSENEEEEEKANQSSPSTDKEETIQISNNDHKIEDAEKENIGEVSQHIHSSEDHISHKPSHSEKKSSFSNQKAHSIAVSSGTESRRGNFQKKSTSIDTESNRRTSVNERPSWSSSTKVEHERVPIHTVARKGSVETEERHTASSIRSNWEKKTSVNNPIVNKTKAFGSSTGAAAMRAQFESQQAFQKHDESLFRKGSVDSEDSSKRFTASSIKARFETMNTEPVVKRNFVINKENPSSAVKKFQPSGAVNSKCSVCGKTVYPVEKLEADKMLFHKFCFKCITCNRTVGLGNYAALEGKIYCKPHLKQLFKLKGNYDEGFGREQRKSDWLKKEIPTENGANSSVESKVSNGDVRDGVTGELICNEEE